MKPSEERFYQHSPIEDATSDVVYRLMLSRPTKSFGWKTRLTILVSRKRTLGPF